jgi:hypothetical protein
MSRFKPTMSVFLTVLALSAVMVPGASAITWVWNGSPVTHPLAVSQRQTLLLEDMREKLAMSCDMVLHGTVGPGREALVTYIEGPRGASERTSLSSSRTMNCRYVGGGSGYCEAGEHPIVAPQNVVWSDRIATRRHGRVRRVGVIAQEKPGEGGHPGWLLECLIFGIAIEDVLENQTAEMSAAALSNVTQGVESRFLDDEAVTPAVTCSMGGQGQGLIATLGASVVKAKHGGTLSVSG